MKKAIAVLMIVLLYIVMPITGKAMADHTGNDWWMLMALPYAIAIFTVATYALIHGPAHRVMEKVTHK